MVLAGWGPENPLLHVTAWVVFCVTALTLLTMAYVLMFSARARRARRQRLSFTKHWRPVMALASVEDQQPKATPPRRGRERLWWLMLWNRMQRQLRGQSKVRLNRLFNASGMERHARRLLHGLSVRRRLVALESFRHYADPSTWSAVAPLCRTRNPFVALAAAHALVSIAPHRGLAHVLEIGLARRDWSQRHLADLCRSAGVEAATPVLLSALNEASPATREVLADFVRFADPGMLQPWARKMLSGTSGPRATLAALRILGELGDPRDHARIVNHLRHGDDALRIAAMGGLRRQARREDVAHFLVSLTDRNFAIRQQAAEALAALPGLQADEARAMLAKIDDPYGRDQFRRAMRAAGLLPQGEGA